MSDRRFKKYAAGVALRNVIRSLGQRSLAAGGLGAVGAAGGGLVGAGVGAARGYSSARDAGESGLVGALQGGARGGLLGGTAGLAVGGLGGALGGQKAQALTRRLSNRGDLVGKASRFGERQVHSVTGATPAGMDRIQGLRAMGIDRPVATPSRFTLGSSERKMRIAKQEIARARKSEELGLTSVPGMFKALASNPSEAGRHMLGNIATPTNAAIGAAFVLPQAMKKSQPGEPSRVKRTLRSVAEMAAYSAAPIGLLGSSVLASGVGRVVGGKNNPQATQPHPEDGASAPVERVYSERARGESA